MPLPRRSSPARPRTRPGLASVLVGCLVAAAFAAAPARAQEQLPADEIRPSVSLVVTAFDGILGAATVRADGDEPGAPAATPPSDLQARVLVENRGDDPVSDLRVVVEIYDPVTSRSELREAVDAGRPHGYRTSVTPDLAAGSLPVGGVTGADITVTAAQGGWEDRDGLFPVRISVLRGTEILDTVTTAVVHLSRSPLPSLSATADATERGILAANVVWPIDDEPWLRADGLYPVDVDREILPGGRLDRLLAAVEAVPAAGVLLAPAPHLLEDLADRADGFREVDADGTPVAVSSDEPAARRAAAFLERLSAIATELPLSPVAGPYADARVGPLATQGDPLAELAGTAVSDGRRRLRELLGREPDGATYLATTPLTGEALGLVPGDHLLLPWTAVEGPDLSSDPDLPPALRTLRSPDGRQLSAAVADPYLTDLLGDTSLHGPTLAAHRVLVETAMIYLERPSEVRGVLVLPPIDWDPNPRAATQLLRRLAQATWITPTSPTRQAVVVDRTAPAELAPLADHLAPDVLRGLRNATIELDALRRSIPPDAQGPNGRSFASLSDQLLRATSDWFVRSDEDVARSLLDDVLADLTAAYGVVEVPDTARITLTSDRGAIPVTLQRPEGGPLDVRVVLDSRGSLQWPEGREQVVSLAGNGTQTVSFEARALGRGTFPVRILVTDRAGARVLEQTTISVRSTAIGGPALWVTVGVVLLLLLAGAIRRREPSTPPLEVVR